LLLRKIDPPGQERKRRIKELPCRPALDDFPLASLIDQGRSRRARTPKTLRGAGVGLLVPPLTSTLLSSVTKQYSGIASGVLNDMRRTGSVLGVALFESLLGRSAGFLTGTRIALLISATLTICALAAVIVGVPRRAN
jgi:hypothetical protein